METFIEYQFSQRYFYCIRIPAEFQGDLKIAF